MKIQLKNAAFFGPFCLAITFRPWTALGDPANPTRLERDWIRQAERRLVEEPRLFSQSVHIDPEADAAGAVDGILDESCGFCTGLDTAPWWQVDLQDTVRVDRIVIHNRPDHYQDPPVPLRVLVSPDGQTWWTIYQHGSKKFGYGADALTVPGEGWDARFIRVQSMAQQQLHLNEIQVYAVGSSKNVALGKPATQSSTSALSTNHLPVPAFRAWADAARMSLFSGEALAVTLGIKGVNVLPFLNDVAAIKPRLAHAEALPSDEQQALYFDVRRAVRALALRNPLLSFNKLLVTKRQEPGGACTLTAPYLGWWVQPGGGLYIVEDFASETPKETCLTTGFAEGGFQQPALSWDARKILFAYCRFYPGLADKSDKTNKRELPEDAFYHLYEMNTDGSGLRQLTFGKYNDFNPSYLPDGRILFLSTRRGWSTRYGDDEARRTLTDPERPDAYAGYGGKSEDPASVYTLHTLKADGTGLQALTPSVLPEWTPCVTPEGDILYTRWDGWDRKGQNTIGLWRLNADGTAPTPLSEQKIKGALALLEARPIPRSHTFVATACAPLAHTGGSLVLLDFARGQTEQAVMTRLTPDAPLPEYETVSKDGLWLSHYYASPWPLSETFFLTAWSADGLASQPRDTQASHAMSVYLYDTFGNLDLLCADDRLHVLYPIPLVPQEPPTPSSSRTQTVSRVAKGCLLLTSSNGGPLDPSQMAVCKQLRVIATLPKTQPGRIAPAISLTDDTLGRCVLGTIPVEPDGSAFFEVPSHVPLSFQALDAEGLAIKTMRATLFLQTGEKRSCADCHQKTPLPTADASSAVALASAREPSKLIPEAEGSWPLRFDRLVLPVIQADCARCHTGAKNKSFAFSADPYAAWKQLTTFKTAPERPLTNIVSADAPDALDARWTPLLTHLRTLKKNRDISEPAFRHILLWIDLSGVYKGDSAPEQEDELNMLRQEWSAIGLLGSD